MVKSGSLKREIDGLVGEGGSCDGRTIRMEEARREEEEEAKREGEEDGKRGGNSLVSCDESGHTKFPFSFAILSWGELG